MKTSTVAHKNSPHRSMIVLPLVAGVLIAAAQLTSQPRVTANRQAETKLANGVVYHDHNENGRRDSDEDGIPGIRVSNGRDIVITDDEGKYRIPVDDDTILFVIKPRDWRTPIDEELQLPRFYYIHKPKGSPSLRYPGVEPTGPLPKSVDFALIPQAEPDTFKAVLFGDPQPRNQQEIDYAAHDVVEELIGTDASFGVTLGDILFDDLSLFESQARSIALIGIPWYNVIGNHDINYDAKSDFYSDETFERAFGPAYYSFDYGTVHFLVLDDIAWTFDENSGKGRYRGGLGPQQMEFIRNDLAGIPKDQMVVLMMHIPLVNVDDRQELYRLIEQRPFCISVSGHTHHHEHRFITRADGWRGPQPHHHIINVTVSGSWWSGSPDERGIPHTMMADGAPNGYSILRFDGNQYSLAYKAAGRSADYQMNIDAPESVTVTELENTAIHANIFNGSELSRVEMQIGESGAWVKMDQTRAIDPLFQSVKNAEQALEKKPWNNLPNPKPSTHLWQAKLPGDLVPGTYLIRIRSSDRIAGELRGTRIIRVIADPKP